MKRDRLTQQQLAALLSGPNCHTLTGLRDRAVLELLAASGVRVGELCGLDCADVDFVARSLRIKHEKSREDKSRDVPVTAAALVWLRRYWDARRSDWPASPALLGRQGRRLAPRDVQRMVANYTSRAGIPGRVVPHSLRHTTATMLIEGGASVHAVQQILGHADYKTTLGYCHASAGWVASEYRKVME